MSGDSRFDTAQDRLRISPSDSAESRFERAAVQILQEDAEAEIEPVLQAAMNASGFRVKQRLTAVWLLGRVRTDCPRRPEIVDRLLAIVNQTAGKDTGGAIVRWIMRTGVAALLLSLLFDRGVPGPRELLSLSFGLALPMLFVSSIVEKRRINRVRAAAVSSLGSLQDPRAIRPLAECLFLPMPAFEGAGSIRRAAAEALRMVLAPLTEADYGSLDNNTLTALCKAVYHPDDRVVLAVLRAMEKAGGGEAAATVKKMVRRGRTAALRAAAASALPVLEERQRAEQAPRVLLRASANHDVPAALLLRPAAGESAVPENQLLRPASADGDQEEAEC